MRSRRPWRPVALLLLSAVAMWWAASPASGYQEQTGYQNLQVLPPDIDRDALIATMVEDNLLGLGLPQRDAEGCLYCHVGDMDVPRDDWDYASDAKVEKRKAREMMAMVAAINDTHLAALESRINPDLRVSCATCHAGRTDPRPLPDVLLASYEESGIETMVSRYERLRERYFGADAYDFRPIVLARLAGRIAATDSFADAITLANTNLEIYPDDHTANQTVQVLQLQEVFWSAGVEPALQLANRLAAGDNAEWFTFGTLDSLGWSIFRRGREQEAVAVFRSNLERFPDEYIPHESLADALISTDQRDAGVRLYEHWLADHPGHEIARRRLASLRGR